jgi:trans-2-enoyl-CoA reductase
MEITRTNLVEAKRQLDSTIHKLKETIKTLEGKENPNRYKSQITLAQRRIEAFELSVYLIEREIRDQSENS